MPGARRRGRPRTAWMDNIKTCSGLSVEESIRMTEDREINGESTSMVWPTFGSRTAKEQNRTVNKQMPMFAVCRGCLNLTHVSRAVCSTDIARPLDAEVTASCREVQRQSVRSLSAGYQCRHACAHRRVRPVLGHLRRLAAVAAAWLGGLPRSPALLGRQLHASELLGAARLVATTQPAQQVSISQSINQSENF